MVAASPYSRLPVYRGSLDTIIGILHIKDVVTRYVQAGALTVASLLRPIVAFPDSMPADRLLAFLRERRSHQALVVGQRGSGRRADHARRRCRRTPRRRRRRVQVHPGSTDSPLRRTAAPSRRRCAWIKPRRSSATHGEARRKRWQHTSPQPSDACPEPGEELIVIDGHRSKSKRSRKERSPQ